ncbi:probable carboxylesterase 2 [Quercus robur]|uniref:probable carboxylesterase 2 n=1 Tax=Quercus robur TaxID=38942 RepID=UPI0021612C4E|nr:probable carboxylesterase 2 [Quercus robur]
MDSSKAEIAQEFPGMIRVYRDGHVERLVETDFVPASNDTITGVTSKDITILSKSNISISARLYLPTKLANPNQKLPLLVYFHGGAFCLSSPFTSKYYNYVNTLVSEANVVAISVNYRKAPEHPIPAAYEDSWAALQWVESHCNNGGPEAWLNEHVDFERVFLAGESSGANVAYNLAMKVGETQAQAQFGLKMGLLGVALVHPFFWGSNPTGSDAQNPSWKAVVDRLWPFVCPAQPDNDNPWANPVAEGAPSLAQLGCRRVLVCVAEKDILRDRGWLFYEALSRSGWMGVVEIEETEGEDHGFHLNDLKCEKARDLIKHLADFFNRDMPPLI